MADIREMIAQSFPDATRTYRALTDNPGAAFDGLMANLLGGGEQVRNRLYDTARTAGQSVAQFQQNPLATAQQWGARLGGDVTQQVREALNNAQAGMSVMPQVSDQATRQAIPAMLGAVTPLQTVWHGTPHRFEPVPENPLGRFDISRIGTGEGAQVYGHGLYVAENPAVAKDYRTNLTRSKQGTMLVDGEPVKGADAWAASALLSANGDAAAVHAAIPRIAVDPKMMAWQERIAAVDKIAGKDIKYQPAGAIYKVDLPDKHIERMLDWDKPLSQQPESVQKAFGFVKKEMPQFDVLETGSNNPVWKYAVPGYPAAATQEQALMAAREAWNSALVNRGPTGAELYKEMASKMSSRDKDPTGQISASNKLNAMGVPGIKYLDQGSRNMPARSLSELQDALRNTKEALKNPPIYNTERFKEIANENIASLQKQIANYPKQTRNYVVFSDDILKILARE